MITQKETAITNSCHAQSLFTASLGLVNEVLKLQPDGEVSASFSGSGDSGQVEDITLPDVLEAAGQYFTYIRPIKNASNSGDGNQVSYQYYTGLSLDAFFAMFTDDLLELTGLDYCNNEGGQGDVKFEPSDDGLEWHITFSVNTERCHEKERNTKDFFDLIE